jgi:3-oxoacyl-[acyl-carrier protein] reductase
MPLMEQSWQTYLDQLEFFVKAPLELLQAVLPDWRARKSGRIINIGSEIAELGNPYFGNYASAKGAMLSMTRSWARELAPEGITVNLVAPGWIPVERHAGASQQAIDGYLAHTPLAHFGKPEDIADAVVFLASSKADFITGQKLAVNGGRTLL